MLDYGEEFWGDRWDGLYDGLAGNPLAAMPSLHFATSVMAAHVLADVGAAEGVAGWAYAGTLGFALVYLGRALRRGPPRGARARRGRARGRAARRTRCSGASLAAVQTLERRAHPT